MRQKYVVLRGLQATRPRSGPAGPASGPAGTAPAPMPRIEYQIDELDPREARDVERSSGVLAVAPAMPMPSDKKKDEGVVHHDFQASVA